MLKRLEEFSEKKHLTDKLVLPFIFTLLKKAFFKLKSPANGGGKKPNRKHSGGDIKTDFEQISQKNSELMLKTFATAFNFLRVDIQEDVSLSALNYISKYLEEPLNIKINNKNTNVNIFLYKNRPKNSFLST